MSIVKRGAYGYGQSKPVMNYHTANSDSVTTVVAEISRLTVNGKPLCTGAMPKHATLEEVCEKDVTGVYSAHHGGAVQKHSYSEQTASYQHGSGVGGYGAAVPHDSTGAAQKHGYGEQKAYQHGVDAGGYGAVHHDSTGAVQKQHGYGEQQAYQYGGDLKGYTALHHESTVEKHGYGGQKAYQHGTSDVAGGYGHDSAAQKHGYGGAYPHGSNAGGYSTVHHESTVQKHGYGGEQKAYPPHGVPAGGYGAFPAGGYGALPHDTTVQKHGYGEKAYQHGGYAGGYGALHHDSATQKHGAGYGGYQHAGDGYAGEHKAYQQGCVDSVGGYGYGGGHKTTYDDVGSFDAFVRKNAMPKQKHGYGGATYKPGCDDSVAGYDALVLNKAMQKQAYAGGYGAPVHGAVTGAVHHNKAQAAYGKTYKHQVPGALPNPCDSESDCSSEEGSDCEEELAYGGMHGATGGNKLGTTHQYSAYERRQQLGGGGVYESYQSTTTQGYSGGGYGW